MEKGNISGCGGSIIRYSWSLALFSFVLISFSFVLAADSIPSVCCSETNDGALCVNTAQENCAPGATSSPTSCETTSYCRLGTCYDSGEGICMENTPQSVCSEGGGTWDDRPIAEVPQCQLGCCLLGDQASFVSLVRCKKLSSFFGIENNYDSSIKSEVECIEAAQNQDMGACVYEKDFERICEFTTRAECGASGGVETLDENAGLSNERKFYKDYLCSAEELNTACGRQASTTCYRGGVYWQDSCGNLENVYSSDKSKSWNNGKVLEPDKVCPPNSGSNKNCGNCDYLQGSRCSEWDGVLGLGKPADSNYYCKRTDCTDSNGDSRLNGESWCVYDSIKGNGLDTVGSRHFREVCIDGEVAVEPCADFRNEICIEGSIETDAGDFETAACRVNRWQDCVFQTERDDCLNMDRRDCTWKKNVTGLYIGGGSSSGTIGFTNPTQGFTNPTGGVIAPLTGNAINEGGITNDDEEGVCVPDFPPGLKFWEDGTAGSVCAQASGQCVVVYEKGLFDSWSIKSGGECLKDDWGLGANQVCAALGDCGGYVNYVGEFSDDGYEWKVNEENLEISPNDINKIRQGITGHLIEVVSG